MAMPPHIILPTISIFFFSRPREKTCMLLFIFYGKASKQTSFSLFSLCSVHNQIINILRRWDRAWRSEFSAATASKCIGNTFWYRFWELGYSAFCPFSSTDNQISSWDIWIKVCFFQRKIKKDCLFQMMWWWECGSCIFFWVQTGIKKGW